MGRTITTVPSWVQRHAGGAGGARTPDLLSAIQARSQLRHSPRILQHDPIISWTGWNTSAGSFKSWIAKITYSSRHNASAELALRRAVEVDLVGQIVDFVFADMTLDPCDGFYE